MAETKTKAELEKEIEELKAQLESSKDDQKAQKEANKKKQEYYNELVQIKLFKDNDKYKDDVVVILNGRMWRIKRGIEVMVPRKVKAILDDSEKQTMISNEFMEAHAYKD